MFSVVCVQKALLHKQQSQPLLELPMGYKEKEMTAEMMQKREERARKRRLQAAKKAEENKNQTIERLTKTSKAKIKSMKERRSKQSQCPMIRYSDTAQGMAISFPTGVPAPAPAPPRPPPAAPVNCGVSGCTNLKKYSCSETGVPLCSLDCYKRNLLLVQSAAWTLKGRIRFKWMQSWFCLNYSRLWWWRAQSTQSWKFTLHRRGSYTLNFKQKDSDSKSTTLQCGFTFYLLFHWLSY